MGWATVLAAYLLGCIPTGVLVAGHYNVDLRSAGSGNIGATNALRVIGKKAGAITLVGDILKGTVAVLIALKFAGRDFGMAAAAAAVLGHDFPVFLGFKGGKGIATSLGVLLPVEPALVLLAAGVWLISVGIWRYSSLGAIISFCALPVMAFMLERGDKSLIGLCLFIAALAVIKHRANIKRLMRGEEPSIGTRAA
jgi:glycerol-3-phosphate acyltransferase PlsY